MMGCKPSNAGHKIRQRGALYQNYSTLPLVLIGLEPLKLISENDNPRKKTVTAPKGAKKTVTLKKGA